MTEIEYDNQIWTTFSVGVVSSVIILYWFNKGDLGELGILALALGFSVLVYSFILVLGYGEKKSIHLENEDVIRSQELAGRWYPRTRWMGEIILIFIGFIYFKSFSFSYWWIPLSILILFTFMCIGANCCAKEKWKKREQEKKKKEEEWKGFCEYFREYLC